MRKESKYQNRNSSSSSRRLSASVGVTRGCARSSASQSHSVVLKPCRMLWIVVVSYRLAVMKDLTSVEVLVVCHKYHNHERTFVDQLAILPAAPYDSRNDRIRD